MKLYRSVDEIDIREDVWHYLAKCSRPIVMYGMGNGADKIISALEHFGVSVDDFFASDEFVRGQRFHDKTVLRYSDICEKYEDFIILVSFGTRLPEVLSKIYELDEKHELYAPDVPVVCEDAVGELFDLSYFTSHKAELDEACSMLSDELSKQVFCDIIAYRLTGKISYLRRHVSKPDEVYRDLLESESIVTALDLGAYNGDSVEELSSFAPKLQKVTALEPDVRNFRKLCEYAGRADFEIDAHNAAAWDENCELCFIAGGNRNSTLIGDAALKTGAKIKKINAVRPDVIISGCDYIKYDVEGAEYSAIIGSKKIIEACHPKLLVSLYHKSEDIFVLPRLIKALGYSEFYLRRYEYIPAWDLNLIVK